MLGSATDFERGAPGSLAGPSWPFPKSDLPLVVRNCLTLAAGREGAEQRGVQWQSSASACGTCSKTVVTIAGDRAFPL